ncbi:hypothetical protein GCM10023086_25350 [Streptomyces venetus]|uniref:Uncharacterized protein n=1 Tax=Streptomyces venetus TaxID=1701086 RepID=A0ABP8FMB1_9ACTN
MTVPVASAPAVTVTSAGLVAPRSVVPTVTVTVTVTRGVAVTLGVAVPRPVSSAGTVTRAVALAAAGTLPGAGPGREIAVASTAVAEAGAGSAGRLGRWVRGTLRRGHRPIIARTRGALCSPRQNCR